MVSPSLASGYCCSSRETCEGDRAGKDKEASETCVTWEFCGMLCKLTLRTLPSSPLMGRLMSKKSSSMRLTPLHSSQTITLASLPPKIVSMNGVYLGGGGSRAGRRYVGSSARSDSASEDDKSSSDDEELSLDDKASPAAIAAFRRSCSATGRGPFRFFFFCLAFDVGCGCSFLMSCVRQSG